MLLEKLGQFPLSFFRSILEDLIEIAKLLYQADRGLGSNTGDTGDIIRGVTHKSQGIYHLLRQDPKSLFDTGGIENGEIPGMEYPDIVAHQLEKVLIARE